MGFFYLRKCRNILESFISSFLQFGALLSSLLAAVWVPLEAVKELWEAALRAQRSSLCAVIRGFLLLPALIPRAGSPAQASPGAVHSALPSPGTNHFSEQHLGELQRRWRLRLFPLWGWVLSGWAPCTQDLLGKELSWAGPAVGAALGKRQGLLWVQIPKTAPRNHFWAGGSGFSPLLCSPQRLFPKADAPLVLPFSRILFSPVLPLRLVTSCSNWAFQEWARWAEPDPWVAVLFQGTPVCVFALMAGGVFLQCYRELISKGNMWNL